MMKSLDEDKSLIDHTIQYIEEFGVDFIQALTLIPKEHLKTYRNSASAFRIQLEIMEGPVSLVVGLPSDFPSELPMFFDSNRQFAYTPHIEHDGFICFTRNENLVLDEEYPGAIVLDCLKKVIELLQKNMTDDGKIEFLDEFEVYWSRSSRVTAHSIIEEDIKSVRELNLNWLYFEENYYFFVYEKSFDPTTYIKKLYNIDTEENSSKYRCLFVPLNEGTFFMPPKARESWCYETLCQNLFNNLSNENKTLLNRYLTRTPRSNSNMDFLVLSLPIDNARNSLIGIVLSYPNGMIRNTKARVELHPLIRRPKEISLYHFNIERHNKKFLISRTSGDVNYLNKHAVIIGTGAVGSVVAMGLAKLGIGNLTLVDKELLSIENIYRHELGVNRIYSNEDYSKKFEQYKVEGLKEEIKSKYPFTDVKAMSTDIRFIINNDLIDWRQVDIVIVCLGIPNIEMIINRKFHKITKAPPVIYTWVEALGIGGHVLVTLNQQKKGCYQCLFRRLSYDEAISNLSSFAAPYQSFSKSLNGCGSYFTPYSFLDSEQTAHLAIRTVSNVLRGKTKGNIIYSWKGEADNFIAQGYKLSERYHMTEDTLLELATKFIDPHCDVCSEKENKL